MSRHPLDQLTRIVITQQSIRVKRLNDFLVRINDILLQEATAVKRLRASNVLLNTRALKAEQNRDKWKAKYHKLEERMNNAIQQKDPK